MTNFFHFPKEDRAQLRNSPVGGAQAFVGSIDNVALSYNCDVILGAGQFDERIGRVLAAEEFIMMIRGVVKTTAGEVIGNTLVGFRVRRRGRNHCNP